MSRTPPARVLAAMTVVALLAGVALAAPSEAAAARTTKTVASAGKSVAGAKSALTARLTPKATGGTVTFSSAGKTLSGCSKRPAKAGKASCSTTFAKAGTRKIKAAYTGVSKKYRASSSTVTVRTTAAPAKAPTKAGTIVGSTGSCTTSKGALVAVNYAKWNGPIVRGCDTTPTTGIELLTTAKFTTTGTQHDGPAFLCRIGNPLFNGGTQYPTPAEDACVRTPPASAYWSYWLAPKGSNTWNYAQFGAYSQKATDGEVEAWTFGATDIDGTTGKPTFTPNQIRAGMTASVATTQATAAPRLRMQKRALAAADKADLATGSKYLTSNLVDGHYYDLYGMGFADFGLTMDAALALAAAGTDDAALRKLVTFLHEKGKDGSNRTVDNYTSIGTGDASGGAIGKLALVAESTGYDPRTFSGHNLIKALDDAVCAKATKAPDYSCAGKGNYTYASSTFSQALGILAQLRAGDAKGAAKPIAFLEGMQHASGAFPSLIPGKDSETDSTGMVAMALALVPGAKARKAVAAALSWLAKQQESDGGFPGASGNSVNSAAISVQALYLDAEKYAGNIAAAQRFLASQQNADGGFNVAVGTEASGSDVRASTQAVGGVAGIPFGSGLDDVRAKRTAAAGANYLVSKLVDGTHYTFDGSTSPDVGLTADALFALIGAGGHAGDVSKILTYLKGEVGSYAYPSGEQGGPYSGGLAKLALAAEATGQKPQDFAGTDLLGVLASKVCSAAVDGDYSPCTAKGDFYNAVSGISQALGVLALQASADSGDHLSFGSAPVVRLRQLQCPDGGFTSKLIVGDAACKSDVDMTGYAIQALAAVPNSDAVLGKAQHYLQGVQKSSGLYPGTSADNSNSTALAANGLQTLVTALICETVDPPGPKTIAPITNWQAALRGLRTLAVPAGGFGVSSKAAADVRASTQAVLAAAHSTLVSLASVRIASTPRDAAVADPGKPGRPTPGPSGSTAPTASDGAGSAAPDGGSASPVAGGSPADTGVDSLSLLTWALAALLSGAVVLWAGRRRVTVGRHRAAHR